MIRSTIFQAIAVTFLIFLSARDVSGEENLISYKSMSMDLALKAARSALQSCRDQGFMVSVAVIERGGATQVILRDQVAGIFTPDIALRKARTALSFKTDTTNLVEPTSSGKPASGLRGFPDAIFVGGGVRIEAGGLTVGAIGVSGAPGSDIDVACAKAGIESIIDILDF